MEILQPVILPRHERVLRSNLKVILYPDPTAARPMLIKRVELDGRQIKYRKVEIVIDANSPVVEAKVTFLPGSVTFARDVEIVEDEA